MDPTHFIASNSLPCRSNCRHDQAKVDAFYDQNGDNGYIAISRLPQWFRMVIAKLPNSKFWKPDFAKKIETR